MEDISWEANLSLCVSQSFPDFERSIRHWETIANIYKKILTVVKAIRLFKLRSFKQLRGLKTASEKCIPVFAEIFRKCDWSNLV